MDAEERAGCVFAPASAGNTQLRVEFWFASEFVSQIGRLIKQHPTGMVVASHRLAPSGAGQIVRSPEHAAQLENVVLGAFSTDRPCPTKTNRPPTPAALDLAARITGHTADPVVVDLAAYQAAADHTGSAR